MGRYIAKLVMRVHNKIFQRRKGVFVSDLSRGDALPSLWYLIVLHSLNQLVKKSKTVFVGDSLLGNCRRAIEDRFGAGVSAISADTSTTLLWSIAYRLATLRPEVVICHIGAVDGMAGKKVDDTAQNIIAISKAVEFSGKKFFWLQCLPVGRSSIKGANRQLNMSKYNNSFIKRLTSELEAENVAIIYTNTLLNVDGWAAPKYLLRDGLHLSKSGEVVLMDCIEDFLKLE